MADIQVKKPIMKKPEFPEEMNSTPVMEEVLTMEDKVESELAPKLTPEAKLEIEGPKQYRCKTQCWVKKRVYEIGEVEIFMPGEFVPEHFTEIK